MPKLEPCFIWRMVLILIRKWEMEAIQEALERNDGNKPKAAEELGISLKTLYNRLKEYSTVPVDSDVDEDSSAR